MGDERDVLTWLEQKELIDKRELVEVSSLASFTSAHVDVCAELFRAGLADREASGPRTTMVRPWVRGLVGSAVTDNDLLRVIRLCRTDIEFAEALEAVWLVGGHVAMWKLAHDVVRARK